MKKIIDIIPAILAKSSEEFESMVRAIEPYADLVHIDIADGDFVPNKTISIVNELVRIKTDLKFEVHLMVRSPEKIIEEWLNTKVIRYLIHIESTENFKNLINIIKNRGREFAGVLNPKTDYKKLEEYLDRIDMIQFMTVDPGFYGSPFLEGVLNKVKEFHFKYPQKIIQLDGGINPKTIKLIGSIGVSKVVVGSFIFRSQNIKEALEELKNSMKYYV